MARIVVTDVKHIGGCPICGNKDWCTFHIDWPRDTMQVWCRGKSGSVEAHREDGALFVTEGWDGMTYGYYEIKNISRHIIDVFEAKRLWEERFGQEGVE